MGFADILFWVVAVITVGSAGMVLFSRGIVHMAFWLLSSLAGFAGLYLLLGADFLGFTQIIVYIGGILILFLFGVMLTHTGDVPVRERMPWKVMAPGIVIVLVMSCVLIFLVVGNPWLEAPPEDVAALGPAPVGEEGEIQQRESPAAPPTAEDIGVFFMSKYILPFEVVSVLLLVALIGATYVARSRAEEGSGSDDATAEEQGGVSA